MSRIEVRRFDFLHAPKDRKTGEYIHRGAVTSGRVRVSSSGVLVYRTPSLMDSVKESELGEALRSIRRILLNS